jgi:outer membrane protein OmpA-like peptidoglycan-associated protein
MPRLTLVPLGVALLSSLIATPADAQLPRDLRLSAELGAGGMLPDYQRDELGLDALLFAAARIGWEIAEPVGLHLAWEGQLLPFGERLATQNHVLAGVRVDPRIGDVGRFWVDAYGGLGVTLDKARFALSAGVGFELEVGILGLGPFVRYTHLFAAAEDFPSDAQALVGGISVTLREPAPAAVEEPEARDAPAADVVDEEPSADRDRDGLDDAVDVCPDVVPGLNPDPERPGCPSADRDADAVPDHVDACPDEAGAPHPDPARHGCPGLGRIEGDQLVILRPIFFETNLSRILPESEPVLRAIAQMMGAMPRIRRVRVEGHTDDRGDDEHNLQLSQERAQAVVEWLVGEGGVEPERLEARGFGEARPLIPGQSDGARAANRRVELRIVDPVLRQAGSVR